MTWRLSRSVWTSVAAAVALIVMGTIGLLAGRLTSQPTAVVLWDLHPASSAVVRGGILRLEFTVTRYRICDGRVERWLRIMQDGKPVWFPLPETANPPTPLNVETSYSLLIPVPQQVPDGEWSYFSRSRDGCGSLFTAVSAVRDSKFVPLVITNPDQAQPTEIMAPPGPVTIIPVR